MTEGDGYGYGVDVVDVGGHGDTNRFVEKKRWL